MRDRNKLEQQPGHAAAEQGTVVLDGPNGVAITMTPEAAEQTARNLEQAADEARRQRGVQR
ncbi:hypothetical protein [Sphingomonas sp. DT-204]|uniref:hypothetical protein n=1 Tax=Sphingomonas sp. DT-204 TaxID=3396166 RepID=UPI003F1A0451